MSLARALTSATKRMRPTQDGSAPQGSTSPNRSFSTRRNYGGFESIDRNQISLPIELLSTTNPLAYDAPDLKDINIRDFQHLATSIPSPSPSSATSYISDSDSAGFSSGASSASSLTTPSMSRESSPTATDSFFCEDIIAPTAPASIQSRSSVVPPPSIPEFDESAPEIPKRALSHTKKTHEVLARKRSSSRMRSPPSSTSLNPRTLSPVRTSFDIFNPSAVSTSSISTSNDTSSHPFGAELAQVNELVEEIASPASSTFSPVVTSPVSKIAPAAVPSEKTSFSDLRVPKSPRRMMTRSPAVSERGAMVDLAHQHSEKAAVKDREVRIVDDEDDRFILERGLARWGVDAYLKEIEELYTSRWTVDDGSTGGWF